MSKQPPLRVVIADDVAELRELVRIKLELEPGCEVVGEAANGVEAVAVAAATQPDCILLDLAMPIMDGLQAIPEVRRVAPHARIAVLTGFDGNTVADTAAELGADLYLNKATALVDLPAPLLQLGVRGVASRR